MPSRTAFLPLLASLSTLATATTWWHPTPNTTWQIVLSAPLTPSYISPAPNPNSTITALDGDLFDNANETWSIIKSAGYKTICYFSAGSYEDWRPDAASFHPSDLGDALDGWPGEKWLNTRSANVRAIMRQRLDLAAKQGCDAVDPDNTDAYDNGGGGLGLTTEDAVDYVRFLAQEAHGRGLAMGLKNGGTIVGDVLNVTDFQVNEQCLQYDECDTFQPFVDSGKPVFEIEYTKKDSDDPARDSSFVRDICQAESRKGFSTLVKHMSLDQWAVACEQSVGAVAASAVPRSTSASMRCAAMTSSIVLVATGMAMVL